MHLRKVLVFGLLVAVGAAGCGGTDDGDDGIATAGGAGGGASASPSAAPMTDEERQVKFAQCMRDQGIDMPDPEIDGGKVTIKMSARPGAAAGDPQKMDAAMEKCRQYLPNGGERQKPNPEQLEQARKMSQCMREHGVPDFPDPEPDGGIKTQVTPGSKLNPDDPTFKAAQEACDKYAPKGPGGGPMTNKEQG